MRTTLWVIPSVLMALAFVLFVFTNVVDRASAAGNLSLPSWINTGGPDAARAILTAIAAAVMTVVGVVFSITIVALTLAATQFGPRMLRNFIRDFGTQLALGTFVATLVFCVLALGSVSSAPTEEFVPHLAVTVALALTLVDLGVLIYFIHHVATSIQITEVIQGIAHDLGRALDAVAEEASTSRRQGQPSVLRAMSPGEVRRRLDESGVPVPATSSGYLQAISHRKLVKIARSNDAIVRIVHRPGNFVVKGRPIAVVWPSSAEPSIARAMRRAHVIGANRTLAQDLQFGIDQLVEIALRALSPAVNDTYTALTCIDWLGDAMCKVVSSGLPDGIYRDEFGTIRLIEVELRYDRIINRAFDKIRQAGRSMPAVSIRQLENLAKIAEHVSSDDLRSVVTRQADMILRSAEEAIPEENDRADVLSAFQDVVASAGNGNDHIS